jgi:ankyrin repeat protein
VKLLISKGADINHRSTYTALELAEMAGNKDVAAYLKSLKGIA